MTIEEKVFERRKFIPEKLLRYGQAGIYPAYHMDKENWVSITLDETLEDDVITNIIDLSFNVTNEK